MKALLGVVAGLLLAGVISTEGCASKACTQSSDCGSNEMCVFKIGSCSVPGECQAPPSGPQCNAEIDYCGCAGGSVIGGCGFPSGYASGPTTGASGSCGDGGALASTSGEDAAVQEAGPTGEASSDSGTCTTNADCASGNVCAFPQAAGCAATGACFPGVAAVCNVIEPACACDGTDIILGCNGLPGGHAAKPFAHTGACGD